MKAKQLDNHIYKNHYCQIYGPLYRASIEDFETIAAFENPLIPPFAKGEASAYRPRVWRMACIVEVEEFSNAVALLSARLTFALGMRIMSPDCWKITPGVTGNE